MKVTTPTFDLLVLMSLPKVGAVTVRKYLAARQHGMGISTDWGELFFRDRPDDVVRAARIKAESIAAKCEELGIEIVSALDSTYPGRLLGIDDFPPIVYLKGSLDAWALPCVAVVGTREASALGLSYAKQTANILASRQFCVVSGLALGIDTAAHMGALEAEGTTVAVLAHGLDTVSPATNRKLASKILESEGALISEHPPGTPAFAPEFVRRNRIQSGLSLASIMVESGEKGGSIHQARFTTQQKRRLYAVVPKEELGSEYSFSYGGAAILEREFGAIRIQSREDVQQLADELDPR